MIIYYENHRAKILLESMSRLLGYTIPPESLSLFLDEPTKPLALAHMHAQRLEERPLSAAPLTLVNLLGMNSSFPDHEHIYHHLALSAGGWLHVKLEGDVDEIEALKDLLLVWEEMPARPVLAITPGKSQRVKARVERLLWKSLRRVTGTIWPAPIVEDSE